VDAGHVVEAVTASGVRLETLHVWPCRSGDRRHGDDFRFILFGFDIQRIPVFDHVFLMHAALVSYLSFWGDMPTQFVYLSFF
jgi:hypothetical protein